MELFLLDMGDEKYGDAILVVDGDKKLLIDGAHINDFKKRGSAPPIQDQLASILGAEAPFRFDLLVVTHCHGDHIGCLPTLVADGIVEADWALLAHEDLGYPDANRQDASTDPVIQRVVAALREEPRTDFPSDAELNQFLTDAMNLEQRYRAMLKALAEQGTSVIRFAGTDDGDTADDLRALERHFSSLELKILGPTQSHLLRCTQAIEGASQDAARIARSIRRRDASIDAADLYKTLAGMTQPTDSVLADDVSQFLDRPGKGAALNNQSIIIKLGSGNSSVLLTGDMQLASAEVSGLDEHMSALLEKLAAAGPYAFVKLAHHASYNGFDDTVARALGKTKVYGITTGRGDPGHPHEAVLDVLTQLQPPARWVRTDKNGAVEVRITNGRVTLKTARGRLSDPSPNREDAGAVPPAAAPLSREALPPSEPEERPSPPESIERGAAEMAPSNPAESIEVFARVPHTRTKVVITIDVEPGAASGRREEPSLRTTPERSPQPGKQAATELDTSRFAAGRKLPALLFVTHMEKLAENIGANEAKQVARLIEGAGQRLLDVRNPADPLVEVRAVLQPGNFCGVVIIGGYDVLMPLRYDTIPPELRANVASNGDPDDFIVWSDQAYGDTDGDLLGELPVSRIPDGRSAKLVRNALCAPSAAARAQVFGLRNSARPFADEIYRTISMRADILVSEPTRAHVIDEGAVDATSVYIMLHGSDVDSSRFWGELAHGGSLEALNVDNIPDPCGGIVLSGCCWGALAARPTAVRYHPGDRIQSLTPEQSIALNFILMGVRAFVGCTGAHYSPIENEREAKLNYFGAPLHRAFWSHVRGGKVPPAEALFKAKLDYIRDMPHGRKTAEEQAIEYKILRQFTCLGLGW